MTLLFPTPVVYDGNDGRYLARDGARFLAPLAQLGHAGVKVVLAKPDSPLRPTASGLRTGTFADWCAPSFWQGFHADAALCYFGFSARRYLPVVRALRSAGLRLALKTDTSFGLHRFPHHASVWARKCYWVARERHAPLVALVQAAIGTAKWMHGPNSTAMAEYLGQFDTISAESPMAVENTRGWLERHGRPDIAERVTFLPHPVPDDFFFDPAHDRKENLVLAVAADWRNPRKGCGILAGALGRFLSAHPNWHAMVVGENSDAVCSAAGSGGTIEAIGKRTSTALLSMYRAAKIFLIASGSEAAPNVVFESISCGCSLVFPPELLQFRWVCDAGLGTMSRRRSAAALAEALAQEAAAWIGKNGRPPVVPLPTLRAVDQLGPLLASLKSSGSLTNGRSTPTSAISLKPDVSNRHAIMPPDHHD